MLRRLAIIKAAQGMGITLEDIGSLFAGFSDQANISPKDVEGLISLWKDLVQKKIDELIIFREQIDGCIGCGCLSNAQCPIRNKNDHLGKNNSGAVLLRL